MNSTDRQDELVLSRLLRVPRPRVWAAWTDPEQLGQWWGPQGFTIGVRRFQLEPGGIFLYWMQAPGPAAERWWGRFSWREVSPMDRLSWINSFSNPDGGITRAPFAPSFPAEVYNRVDFTDEDGGTRLLLRSRPVNTDAEGRASFAGMLPSMNQGFTGTFDQLEAFLDQSEVRGPTLDTTRSGG